MFIKLNNALNARKKDEKGFTLIELLVVVLIIGILAAIAIPVFIGQQATAQDAAAKADIASERTAVVAYAAANNGEYSSTGLDTYGGVAGVRVSTTTTTFCIAKKSDTDTVWKTTNVSNAIVDSTVATEALACP